MPCDHSDRQPYTECRGQRTSHAIADPEAHVNDNVQNELTKSFASAADTAQQYPAQASQIIAGAKSAFLQGDDWAYVAGIIAVLLGAVLVYFKFPTREDEERLLAEYATAAGEAEAG